MSPVRGLVRRWWGGRTPLLWPLLPLSGLYCALVLARRAAYRRGLLAVRRPPVPVVVVGNLTVGGSGKTPLVIALARWLAGRGRRPGIVSRGYGGRAGRRPVRVTAAGDPVEVGDEPVLMARAGDWPVVVARDRAAGVERLAAAGCDVVLADDGLQHYRLGRDLEIAVVDGRRRYGNRWCLPAGPLREPLSRLASVDAVVCNGGTPAPGEFTMTLVPGRLRPLGGGPEVALSDWAGRPVHAVAGIGHPQRFFDLLAEHRLRVRPHAFPDHHRFRPRDLDFGDDLPIIMTEKDAVKCDFTAGPPCWVLPVTARPDAGLFDLLAARLATGAR